MQKKCHICGIDKPLSCFPKRKDTKSGYRATCKDCYHKQRSAYREKNKEEIAKKKRIYYEKHKEAKSIYDKEYRKQHRQRLLNYQHEYYEKNKEKLLKDNHEYQQNHPEEMKAYKIKYRSTAKGKLAEVRMHHNRRALVRNMNANITLQQWNNVLKSQDNKCNICKRKFTKKMSPTQDHIVPISCGGNLAFENIQALCLSCNSRKQAKLDPHFIQTWAHDGTKN